MKEFVCEIRVRGYELDQFGHVNHAVYLNYLEQARWDALEEGGFSHEDLRREGWGIHIVRVELDYLKPCHQGERLRIHTQVEEFRKSSMTIAQEIFRNSDGEGASSALRGKVVAVWIGEDGRPMRIPEAGRQALGG